MFCFFYTDLRQFEKQKCLLAVNGNRIGSSRSPHLNTHICDHTILIDLASDYLEMKKQQHFSLHLELVFFFSL